jgi:hypothetical protein
VQDDPTGAVAPTAKDDGTHVTRESQEGPRAVGRRCCPLVTHGIASATFGGVVNTVFTMPAYAFGGVPAILHRSE